MITRWLADPRTLLFAICAELWCLSLIAFFPGWMTTDSFSHLWDAEHSVYRIGLPILYSWIWNKLLFVSPVPVAMLLLQITVYWSGWFFLADGFRSRIGMWALLVPLSALVPGFIFELGFLWKDVVFGVTMFTSLALILRAYMQKRPIRIWEHVFLVPLFVIAYGVKTNGIVVLPLVAVFWLWQAGWKSRIRIGLAAIALSILPVGVMTVIEKTSTVNRNGASLIEYTELYDLLGISVRTHELLIPKYVTDKIGKNGDTLEELAPLYGVAGVNSFYWNKDAGGSIGTHDPVQLATLRNAWLEAIEKHPTAYVDHRWGIFSFSLRLGVLTPAYVGVPGVQENNLGLKEAHSPLYNMAASLPKATLFFLPWTYIIVMLASLGVLLVKKRDLLPTTIIAVAIVFFAGPHFFVFPAADFRYLYFCYLMTGLLFLLALASLLPAKREEKQNDSASSAETSPNSPN